MRKRVLMATMAVSTALGFAAAPVTPASAQGYPSYCDGRLQARFYRTSSAANGPTTLSFYMILQNTTRNDVNFAVNFVASQASNRPNGTQFTKLGTFGTSASILLARQTLYMVSHALSLSDLPRYTRVTCQ